MTLAHGLFFISKEADFVCFQEAELVDTRFTFFPKQLKIQSVFKTVDSKQQVTVTPEIQGTNEVNPTTAPVSCPENINGSQHQKGASRWAQQSFCVHKAECQRGRSDTGWTLDSAEGLSPELSTHQHTRVRKPHVWGESNMEGLQAKS